MKAARPPLAMRQGASPVISGRVATWLDEETLPGADRKELVFYRSTPEYGPDSPLWVNLRGKTSELRTFEGLIPDLALKPGDRVLELGAGHGWASALLKRERPDCEVHASEISPDALQSCAKWERLFESRVDGLWACPAQRTPFADGQFDRVFTFAAFHHFCIGGRGREALAETLRLVRPGGRVLLLFEPCVPAWLEAAWRGKLNRIRTSVGADIEEDVLVWPRLRHWARELGADASIRFDGGISHRELSAGGALRNLLVRAVPAAGHLVPAAAHLTFVRR